MSAIPGIRKFVKVVQKGWGHEEWIANSAAYCSKLLHVDKGKKCSLHFHEHKMETFHILKGRIQLEVEGDMDYLSEGMIIDIWPYQHHRFTAMVDSIILEVSTQHFESDTTRIEPGD